MSRENVEIVVGVFEAMNSRDFVAALDAHAEDVSLVLHGEFQHFGGASGKKAFAQWFADWYREFGADYSSEIEETADWGDRVFIVATDHGRGRASGAPITQQIGYVYTVRGGKIVRCDIYPSRDDALEAAGLSE